MRLIRILEDWHEHFNAEEFGGKLLTPHFGITRSLKTDGWYEHLLHDRTRGKIALARRCFDDEDLMQGTLLHEMIHQYQHEVLHRRANHDAIFTSIARRLERKYGFSVR